MSESLDCLVIGAGVIGLAVARQLARDGREVFVIEERDRIGEGASSRNSEVIHAGIYYPPGSLKARLCVEGRKMLYRYCEEHQVPFQNCGKLIVATSEEQISDLKRIQQSALSNGLTAPGEALELLDRETTRRWEPEVHAVAALFSPSTGIIDSHRLMRSLQAEAEARGATVAFQHTARAARVTRGRGGGGAGGSEDGEIEVDVLEPRGGEVRLRFRSVVNAGGLGAQAFAERFESYPSEWLPRLFLSKGNYFSLSGRSPFKRLIYPVPTPNTLGIHATLDLAGQCRFGPDHEAVDRVHYDVDASRVGSFAEAIRKYYPGIQDASLRPAYSGIRAQLYRKGEPVADFRIIGPAEHGIPGLIQLFGIESPGLTSSLAIAARVSKMLGTASRGSPG